MPVRSPKYIRALQRKVREVEPRRIAGMTTEDLLHAWQRLRDAESAALVRGWNARGLSISERRAELAAYLEHQHHQIAATDHHA